MQKKSAGIFLIVKICIPGFSATFCRQNRNNKIAFFYIFACKKSLLPYFQSTRLCGPAKCGYFKIWPNYTEYLWLWKSEAWWSCCFTEAELLPSSGRVKSWASRDIIEKLKIIISFQHWLKSQKDNVACSLYD